MISWIRNLAGISFPAGAWLIFSCDWSVQEFSKKSDKKIRIKIGKNLNEALIFLNKVINLNFVRQKPGYNQEEKQLNNQAINYSAH